MADWGNGSWGNSSEGNKNGNWDNAPQNVQQEDEETYDWDDSFTCEESSFVVLRPGEYAFTVKGFERGYFNGNEKSKACKMAKMTLEVQTEDGKASVKDSFFLKKSAKWRIDDFFRCIGVAKLGQTYQPNWTESIGMTGRAKIKNREYNGKKYNEVDRYVYPKE